ncbi:hypothetical protein Tco_0871203 [Tanacetum coccineum]
MSWEKDPSFPEEQVNGTMPEMTQWATGTIPPKTKGSKKKANTDTIPKLKPPTAPTEKKSGKGKLKTISEAELTEAEQLKLITKRSRQETHSSHASGSGADEGTGITPGVPMLLNYDPEDDISWKSMMRSNEEDSDDEVEGTNVEGAKSDEEVTYTKDQRNEAVKDTNTDLDGRDKMFFVILRQHTEATSLIDTSVTAIMEPSFTAQINRPPTPYPLVMQTQQPPILTPATTTSSSLQNLPNFASLFGFDYRLKALEDNFSELRQTNQYAEAPLLHSYHRQTFEQALQALVEAYEADKILLDTYGDTVTIKRPRDGADDDQEPSAGTDRGSKRRRSGKEPASTSAPIGEAMQSTDVLERPADQEFETGVQDEQAEEEVQHLPDWFQQPTRLPSPDHAWE